MSDAHRALVGQEFDCTTFPPVTAAKPPTEFIATGSANSRPTSITIS